MNNFSKHIDFEKRRMPDKSGLTVVELLVVIGIIAVVVAISLPAFNAMQKSFDSTGAEGMISAALSTARTLAISRQQYVGVRFQTSYDPADVLDEEQYMIFIIYDADKTDLVCGFRAIEGYKPMKLPTNVGVIDKIRRYERIYRDCDDPFREDSLVETDLGDSVSITDTSAFSIVFSPAGKLVINKITCRNKDGESNPSLNSDDQVFNTYEKITSNSNAAGMFIQDDYANLGLSVEMSRNKLVIYNREEFKKLTTAKQRWDYLNDNSKSVYINPYTGGIIEK
ncbi:MAG TPA: hypothetical protein DDW84_04270 [Phycisphaerales bacterium]|nr:MAG: hypothetical protein A2Y13_12075 [Planctomycetes bacterium GWC2_45_44]HBG78051.1 hypothetical protein [Phycisphaerales bacterium]HBR20118.1 hypothetical protein [Phycisphaerales bacterium]